MSMVWSSRNRPPYSNHEDEGASFSKHNEYMRKFHLAHPKVKTVELKDVRTVAWSALVPIQKVKLAKYLQN